VHKVGMRGATCSSAMCWLQLLLPALRQGCCSTPQCSSRPLAAAWVHGALWRLLLLQPGAAVVVPWTQLGAWWAAMAPAWCCWAPVELFAGQASTDACEHLVPCSVTAMQQHPSWISFAQQSCYAAETASQLLCSVCCPAPRLGSVGPACGTGVLRGSIAAVPPGRVFLPQQLGLGQPVHPRCYAGLCSFLRGPPSGLGPVCVWYSSWRLCCLLHQAAGSPRAQGPCGPPPPPAPTPILPSTHVMRHHSAAVMRLLEGYGRAPYSWERRVLQAAGVWR
jgi:hypothetical protein